MNKIKLLGFNEPMLWHIPMVPCEGGRISEVPVSDGEVRRIRDLGVKFELVPAECDSCRDTRRANQELTDEVLRLAEEVTRLKKKR